MKKLSEILLEQRTIEVQTPPLHPTPLLVLFNDVLDPDNVINSPEIGKLAGYFFANSTLSLAFIIDAISNITNDILERACRLEADQLLHLLDARNSPAHVLEAAARIRLRERNVPNLALALELALHEPRKFANRNLTGIPQVDDLPDGFRAVEHQLLDGLHHVKHMAEAARLLAVVVHRNRLIGERRLHEARHHHPVHAGLTRPDRVEEPDHDNWQLRLVVVHASARNSSIALQFA